MALVFEELDFQKTPLGEISLRRRSEPRLDGKILYEVKLGDDFLISSLFTEAEIQLSRLGLAALEDPSVRTLMVIEVKEPVIDWRRRSSLVPLGEKLTSDPRCRLIHADFFELAVNHNGFDREDPDKRVHAVLLDIAHYQAIG